MDRWLKYIKHSLSAVKINHKDERMGQQGGQGRPIWDYSLSHLHTVDTVTLSSKFIYLFYFIFNRAFPQVPLSLLFLSTVCLWNIGDLGVLSLACLLFYLHLPSLGNCIMFSFIVHSFIHSTSIFELLLYARCCAKL